MCINIRTFIMLRTSISYPKKCIFHDFGIMDLRTTEPFRSDSRTFFSNLRTFGLKNLRTHEPSNLRTFGLIGCNPLLQCLFHTAVHPHIATISPCWHGSPLVIPICQECPVGLCNYICYLRPVFTGFECCITIGVNISERKSGKERTKKRKKR